MTTQQTVSASDLPPVFARPRAAVPDSAPFPALVSMNRSVLFHRTAAGIPGWSELVDAHHRAAGIRDARPADRPLSVEDAARAILAGEDPSTAVSRLAAARENETVRATFAKLQDVAVQEVSDRAEAWVTEHVAEIEHALTTAAQSVFDRASAEVANLEGVGTATDLVEHPLAATSWAAIAHLRIELAEIERNASALRPRLIEPAIPGDEPARNWPLVGLLDDYPKVWSRFFMTTPLPTRAGELSPEAAPWDHLDPTVQFRRIAELKPLARVRLGRRYRTHLDELGKQAATARSALQEEIRQEVLRKERGTSGDLPHWQPATPPWDRG